MANNYYLSLLEELNDLLQQKKITEALDKIEEELKMPYVPLEIETKLKGIQTQLKQSIKSEEKVNTQLSMEEIEVLLRGNQLQQMQAVESLCQKNLRDHIEVLQDYFKATPDRLVGSVLIESCIQQELTNEFEYHVDNMIYTFIPRAIEKPTETDGFQYAMKYLKEWLENDNPSFLIMCVEILMQCVYYKLPESYTEDESSSLALTIVEYVYNANQDAEGFIKFKEEKQLEDVCLLEIIGL